MTEQPPQTTYDAGQMPTSSTHRMPKATIFEVARRAGVSTGTVSRALNNRAGVNKETRERVLQIVAEMGYVPDLGARQLARGRRSVIGITRFSQTSLRNPYYTLLIDAIQEALVDAGYAVRILEDEAHPGNVAGVIVPGVRQDDSRPFDLRNQGVPVVVVGQMPEGFSWVEVDNTHGMRDVVEHLIAQGHTRIAHMTGTPIGQTAQMRIDVHRETLERAGLTLPDDLILDGNFTELGGYRAMQRAIQTGLNFTAIACASDEMALGAMQAAEDHGLRIPEDLSVTGFDDISFEGHVPLTTVRQPIREIGHSAAHLMLEMLEGKSPRGELLPATFVVRESSGPAK